jgi:hypothetical protein
MLPLPNFDDSVFDEVRRQPPGRGGKGNPPKRRPSKPAKRGMAARRASLKRSSR